MRWWHRVVAAMGRRPVEWVAGRRDEMGHPSVESLDAPEQRRAELNGANLRGAELNGVVLNGAHLADANLAAANLAGADLASANLTGADLASANLTGADLSRSCLVEATLTHADLHGANLTGADLSNADVQEADLRGAQLDLTILNNTRLHLASWDAVTDWGRHVEQVSQASQQGPGGDYRVRLPTLSCTPGRPPAPRRNKVDGHAWRRRFGTFPGRHLLTSATALLGAAAAGGVVFVASGPLTRPGGSPPVSGAAATSARTVTTKASPPSSVEPSLAATEAGADVDATNVTNRTMGVWDGGPFFPACEEVAEGPSARREILNGVAVSAPQVTVTGADPSDVTLTATVKTNGPVRFSKIALADNAGSVVCTMRNVTVDGTMSFQVIVPRTSGRYESRVFLSPTDEETVSGPSNSVVVGLSEQDP